VTFGPEQRPEDRRPTDPTRGFLQLCSDRRFHLKTMEAFEDVTGLEPEGYWIEARPGGAPSWADNTRAARHAYQEGAAHMGWAAHGDACWGFRGMSSEELKEKLRRTVQKRSEEFPRAMHYGLFAEGGQVELIVGQSALTSEA
jgi:hypothetical protein